MDRIIVITGGTSGYGYAVAEKFAASGDRVIAVARTEENLMKIKNALGVDVFTADVTKEEDWGALSEYIKKEYGRIDLLLNNAGGGVAVVPFLDQTSEQIKASVDLNLLSAIWGCKAFAPMMVSQNGGTIINIASVCAKHAWPAYSIYAAAKAGLLSLSKSLYVELRPMGIRVTCMIPAAGDTSFFANSGQEPNHVMMKASDFAQTIVDVFNLPSHIVVEDMTVWGIDQEIVPL